MAKASGTFRILDQGEGAVPLPHKTFLKNFMQQ